MQAPSLPTTIQVLPPSKITAKIPNLCPKKTKPNPKQPKTPQSWSAAMQPYIILHRFSPGQLLSFPPPCVPVLAFFSSQHFYSWLTGPVGSNGLSLGLLLNKSCQRRQGSGQISVLDGYPVEIRYISFITTLPKTSSSLPSRPYS